jgi:NAD(P)-dependent dehydrogenase (short-subunit alcohol dehydrogenase family)
MQGRLADKVAVITGATSGIGYGTARAFVKEGAHLVFNARTAENGLQVQSALRAMAQGGEVHFIRADISVREQIESVIDLAIAKFGRLDALVNNAQGIPPVRSIIEKPDDEYRYSFESGIFATLWAMRRALPTMRDQGGGSIVNTTSNWAHTAPPNTSDYNSNKAALEGLTRSAAHEWGCYNINVNMVAPAATSAGWDNWVSAYPELATQVVRENPMRRIGDPEYDLGRLTLGLVTEEARFITGQTFDGGGGHLYLRRTYAGTDFMESVDFQAKH